MQKNQWSHLKNQTPTHTSLNPLLNDWLLEPNKVPNFGFIFKISPATYRGTIRLNHREAQSKVVKVFVFIFKKDKTSYPFKQNMSFCKLYMKITKASKLISTIQLPLNSILHLRFGWKFLALLFTRHEKTPPNHQWRKTYSGRRRKAERQSWKMKALTSLGKRE